MTLKEAIIFINGLTETPEERSAARAQLATVIDERDRAPDALAITGRDKDILKRREVELTLERDHALARVEALERALRVASAALELYADVACCDGDQHHEDKCKVGQALEAIARLLP